MNTWSKETQALLSGTLNVPVYADVVPESADLPAVAWYNVGFERPNRVAKGQPLPTVVNHRIMVIVPVTNTGRIDDILTQLWTIDNTSTDQFQQIEVYLNNLETVQPESPVQRCLVDLVLTSK